MYRHPSAIWVRVNVLLTLLACHGLLGCNAQEPLPERAEAPMVPPPQAPALDPVHIGEDRLKSPLLETIRQQIEQTETEETRDVTESLTKQLISADAIMSEARRKNRAAIQQANRQVRMGAARQSPNFVLITVDRLGVGDLGCYGQTRWETPALDRIANDGLRFTQCYAGLSPEASQFSFLSGRFQQANASTSANSAASSSSGRAVAALPRVLWNAGYKTALIGEWSGDSSPTAQGYEESSGWNAAPTEFPDWALLNGKRIALENNVGGQRQISQNDFLVSEVRSFLRDARGRANQFYLHVAIQLFNDPATRSLNADDYAARVRRLDSVTGSIFEALEEHGQTNRTCILFFALSGPQPTLSELIHETHSAGEFRHSENSLSEGNLRVPFLVRWPAHIAPGTTSDEAIGLWDMLPTLSQIAAVSRPFGPVDGRSLADTWQKRQPLKARRIVWYSEDGKVLAARETNWKLLRDAAKPPQLFDLSTDPAEEKDISANHAEVMQRLLK